MQEVGRYPEIDLMADDDNVGSTFNFKCCLFDKIASYKIYT